MKAPRTSNSITDRVVYTGLYVPEHATEPAVEAGRPEGSRNADAPSVVSASKAPALQA